MVPFCIDPLAYVSLTPAAATWVSARRYKSSDSFRPSCVRVFVLRDLQSTHARAWRPTEKTGTKADKGLRNKRVKKAVDSPSSPTAYGPTCLIIAPTSVVGNWEREFETVGEPFMSSRLRSSNSFAVELHRSQGHDFRQQDECSQEIQRRSVRRWCDSCLWIRRSGPRAETPVCSSSGCRHRVCSQKHRGVEGSRLHLHHRQRSSPGSHIGAELSGLCRSTKSIASKTPRRRPPKHSGCSKATYVSVLPALLCKTTTSPCCWKHLKGGRADDCSIVPQGDAHGTRLGPPGRAWDSSNVARFRHGTFARCSKASSFARRAREGQGASNASWRSIMMN